MPAFDDLRAETLSFFSELSDIAGSRGAVEAVQRLAAERQRLLDERLVVVVCGEFKRGKSSLLNALLEEPDLFPVDAFFATCLITTVGYAPEETISVTVTGEDSSLRRLEIKRCDIASYATESGNPRNIKRAQLISIQTPNPRLANGLTFVDTPGVGGVYEQHSAMTLGFLQNASAVVFVADATQPLMESELDFIRRAAASARITDDATGNLFVLTKIDAVADFEEILANTKAKLVEATGWPADTIPVVPVSARAKLDYLRDGSAESLELSNFEALEQVLWASLTKRRGRALLGSALADLDRAACALLTPIETEARALLGEDKGLATSSVEIKDRVAWLDRLHDKKDRWRSDLADQLHSLLHEQQERGQAELKDRWAQCESVYLHDARYLRSPDLLLNQVIADAGAAFSAVSELAGRAAARALHEFSARHGLELRTPEVRRLPTPPVPLTHLSGGIPAADRPRLGLQHWKLAASGSTDAGKAGVGVGMTIGAIVGTMVVPGMGTVVGLNVGSMVGFTLGSTLGTLTGYRDAVKEAEDKKVQLQRERLWAELQELRRSQQTCLAEGLADLVGEYITAATRELESRIAQERESKAEALARLTAARDRVEQTTQLRRAELASERAPLDRVLDHIGRLGARVACLDGTG